MDDSGDAVAADEPAAAWLTAEIDLPGGRRLVLIAGEWYDTPTATSSTSLASSSAPSTTGRFGP